MLRGHAIEARLYAEDPERGFLPQTGTLHRLRFPPPEIARVDTGVRQGRYRDAVLRPDDRQDHRLRARIARRPSAGCVALSPKLRCSGSRPTSDFLARVAAHPEFVARRSRHRLHRAPSRSLVAAPQPAPETAARRRGAVAAIGARGGGRGRRSPLRRPVFALGSRSMAGASTVRGGRSRVPRRRRRTPCRRRRAEAGSWLLQLGDRGCARGWRAQH